MSIEWENVYRYLEGTCNSAHMAIEYFDLDCTIEDVEEAMLDMNLEQCPMCGWWTESCELVDDEGDVVGCDQCRKGE